MSAAGGPASPRGAPRRAEVVGVRIERGACAREIGDLETPPPTHNKMAPSLTAWQECLAELEARRVGDLQGMNSDEATYAGGTSGLIWHGGGRPRKQSRRARPRRRQSWLQARCGLGPCLLLDRWRWMGAV